MGMIHLKLLLFRQVFYVATILAVLISGCTASDSPLRISLYNPKQAFSAHAPLKNHRRRMFRRFQRGGNVRETIGSPRIR